MINYDLLTPAYNIIALTLSVALKLLVTAMMETTKGFFYKSLGFSYAKLSFLHLSMLRDVF